MRLRSLAAVGLVAVLTLGACARDEARPSGVAESWLQEVANQGRKGTRDDAKRRADELGSPEVAASLIPGQPADDERYFSDFEVGQAAVSEDDRKAQVPYRLTARTEIDGKLGKVIKSGVLILDRRSDGWYVSSAAATAPKMSSAGPAPDLEVPSEGGPLPARARPGHWLTALLLGIALTTVSVLLVERQPKPSAGSARGPSVV